MKKLIILSLLNFCSYSQTIIFTDLNFKTKLLSANTNNGIATNSTSTQGLKIDVNNNNEIEISEVLAVEGLFLDSSNINDIQGIENFTNLKRLFLYNNNVVQADFTALVNLEKLSISLNPITYINITNLPKLRYFNSAFNPITNLDFSTNPMLNDLYIQDDPNLSYVNLKNGKLQVVGAQATITSCWYNLPNLTTICADDFEISTLQDYINTCGLIEVTSLSSTCALANEKYETTKVEVSPNPSNGIFLIKLLSSSFKSTIEVYNFLGQKIIETETNENQFNLNLSNFASGAYFLKITNDGAIETKKILKI